MRFKTSRLKKDQGVSGSKKHGPIGLHANESVLPQIVNKTNNTPVIPTTAESTHIDYRRLRDRLGIFLYRQRMNMQLYHAAQVMGAGRTRFHPENMPLLRRVLSLGLKATGLYWLGNRNARRIRVQHNEVALRRLPDVFIGYRILQISDLHLDIDPGITDALLKKLDNIEYDLCVITGDYRAETYGDITPAMEQTRRVISSLKTPVLAILGNHDFLEMLPCLESMGVKMLMNEHVPVSVEEQVIYVVGIDDPHFYETEDIEQAIKGVPPEATTILLAHSAEVYRKALACGIDYVLCGHTHGGQICLPGGRAILHNAHHPRQMIRGAWRYHDLQGYTSTGTGCSMVPVRFFCPPEIVLHTLRRAGTQLPQFPIPGLD